MTDPESTPVPLRLDVDDRLVGDNASGPGSHSALHTGSKFRPINMSQNGPVSKTVAFGTRPLAAADVTRFPASSTSGGNLTSHGHGPAAEPVPSQPAGYPSSSSSQHRPAADNIYPSQLHNRHALALSRSNSQGTSSTNGADPVFTPPASGGKQSPGTGSAHDSSQESQLLQLSQIAAAQERIPEDTVEMAGGPSRKRMADGMVKHAQEKSDVSPRQMGGHSRNTSTASVASTAGSRIGELSTELRARLAYAMIKVHLGWQSHSIDQVESLAIQAASAWASQAASPASNASTIHQQNGSSASPQQPAVSHRASNNTSPATGPQHQDSGRSGDPQLRDSPQSNSRGSSASPVKTNHGLAPPVSIQPSQHMGNPRREPNPRQIPPFLSNSHHHSPHAGAHTSPYLAPTRHRSALSEAMLVSPHTNVREQDAIESLLFMSSPGNSANLKHAFPSSSSQPLPSSHTAPQRTALPTSQPRKSLPSGRPPQHGRSQSHSHTQVKRVNFEKSPSAMDIDDPSPLIGGGSPMSISRGTPRRRINGGGGSHNHYPMDLHPYQYATAAPTPKLKQLPVSAGLTVSSKPRPALADEEIDRMLDRAAAAVEDSDSEGEIELPTGRRAGEREKLRREGAGVVL